MGINLWRGNVLDLINSDYGSGFGSGSCSGSCYGYCYGYGYGNCFGNGDGYGKEIKSNEWIEILTAKEDEDVKS